MFFYETQTQLLEGRPILARAKTARWGPLLAPPEVLMKHGIGIRRSGPNIAESQRNTKRVRLSKLAFFIAERMASRFGGTAASIVEDLLIEAASKDAGGPSGNLARARRALVKEMQEQARSERDAKREAQGTEKTNDKEGPKR